jgi:hypothetical protein
MILKVYMKSFSDVWPRDHGHDASCSREIQRGCYHHYPKEKASLVGACKESCLQVDKHGLETKRFSR